MGRFFVVDMTASGHQDHELGSSPAGRKRYDTLGQLPFTLCRKGCGKDVGATTAFGQVPECREQLFIRQVLD